MPIATGEPRKEISGLSGFSVSMPVLDLTVCPTLNLWGKLTKKGLIHGKISIQPLALNNPDAFEAVVKAVK